MSWPTLSECERFVDWSFYQSHGWPLYKPFDVDAFCEAHPEVDGAVLRFCWPSGKVDKHYAHYYDGFTRNEKRVIGYGWPNPNKNISAVMEDWKIALGDRIPKAIFRDWEEASVFKGKTNAQITDHLKAINDVAPFTFPDAEHGDYSRAGWLDTHIIVGEWFHELRFWLAHWPYPPPDFKDEAHSFSELDSMLPIGNDFTPYRGRVVKIRKENVVGWQASSKLTILPRGCSDGGYFLKSFLAEVFDGELPAPPPPPIPGMVELIVPAGTTVTVTERDI